MAPGWQSLRGLGLTLIMVAAGCGSSPCRRACTKLAACSGADLDAGILFRKSSVAEEIETPSTSTGSSSKGFACNLGEECLAKDACLARCVEKASCAALTGKDPEGEADLRACRAGCESLERDGGRVSAGDGGAVTCTPSCAGKQCGDDGCGGSCGLCLWPSTCTPSGRCSCDPGCSGSDCAACGPGLSCGAGGICEPGSAVAGCGSIGFQGCCSGTVLKYCESGKLQTLSCSSNPYCGWTSLGYYDCGTSGGSDPSGKYPKLCY